MKMGFSEKRNIFPFMVGRARGGWGKGVLFLVPKKWELCRPENRYHDVGPPYPDWVVDVSPLRGWQLVWPNPKRHHIVGLLRQCDAVILNDIGPSIWPYVRRPSVALLTGSDLDVYANP